jgi:hypothetical protein
LGLCSDAPSQRPIKTAVDLAVLIDELALAHADCRASNAAWISWWQAVKKEAAK